MTSQPVSRIGSRAILLLVFLGALAACREASPPGGERDGGRDAGADAADSRPDALPLKDAAPPRDSEPPVGIPHDFCHLPFFQLPIDGNLEEVLGADVWGDRVVISKYKGLESELGRNIHLFDLGSCTEYRLTYQRNAAVPIIRENTVFWVDFLMPEDAPPDHVNAVYRYSLSSWREEMLFSYPVGTRYIHANETVLAFSQGVDPQAEYFSLNVYDLRSGLVNEIVPARPPAPYFLVDWHHLGDRYLVFTSYTDDPRSEGRDVFVHDLETGLTAHVPSTFAERQNLPRVWGNHAVWSSSIYRSAPPHRLVLYHIPTGEELDIVSGDGAATAGKIHKNLVVYTTDRYYGMTYTMYPADLEIYDINTGVYRRITTMSAGLRAFRFFFPWVLVHDNIGSMRDWYVLNLVSLGVTDEDGNVIPGEPVLDPPLHW